MLKDTLAPLIDLVYPPRCPLCGEGVGAEEGLCETCRGELVVPREPACALCLEPLGRQAVGASRLCSRCREQPPIHDGITAATIYTEAAKRLVVSFKQGRRIALAPLIARAIAERLPALEGEWLVVPVPLHRWRLWQRGFNQAALLGGEIARLRGQRLVIDALVRQRHTRSLSKSRAGRTERAAMLGGAIAVNPARAARLSEAQVLLVDDVLTSGATSQACVAALKGAGAAKVRIACFARVASGFS